MMNAPPYMIPMRQVGGGITVFKGAAVPHIVQRGGGIGAAALLSPLFRAGARSVVARAAPLAKKAILGQAKAALASGVGGVVSSITGKRRGRKRKAPSTVPAGSSITKIAKAAATQARSLLKAKRRKAVSTRRTAGLRRGIVRRKRRAPGVVMARQRVIQTGGRYPKGSAQAKRFMSKLRAMRTKRRPRKQKDIFGENSSQG